MRIVLGEGEWADVPISTGVAASGALPMIYEPVRINGREFIDGGIRSASRPVPAESPDSLLDPDAIADTYFHVARQARNAWTWEVELRPWVERF